VARANVGLRQAAKIPEAQLDIVCGPWHHPTLQPLQPG